MKGTIRVPYLDLPENQDNWNNCISYCLDRARTHGGKAVTGWRVDEDCELFTILTHHSVWEDSEGCLWDITPYGLYGDEFAMVVVAPDSIDFLPDPSAHFDLSRLPACLPNRYIPKIDNPRVIKAAEYLERSSRFAVENDEHKKDYWFERAVKAYA